MPCYSIDGISPVVDPRAFVHPLAVLIGDVIVSAGCYIAPTASLRGDFGRIELRDGSNVQDSCVLHGFPGSDTIIEKDGHVGHGAIVHGAIVGENSLIGMGAVLMDGVKVEKSAIVASMAFLKAGFVVPSKHLVAGIPAKVIRELRDEEIVWKSKGTHEYQQLAVRSAQTMEEVSPLSEVEPGRQRLKVSTHSPKHQSEG